MPIIEYRCGKCSEVFEYLRLRASDTDVACPHCGGRKVEQQFSVFAAQSGRSSGSTGDCFNRSAGLCEAGGGAMA
jgi:putative FmdB family regulatory protein